MTDRMGDLAASDSYDLPQPPPDNLDWSRYNQPFGTLTDTNPVQYKTASPLVEIRPSDIDTATNMAMGFSGGGLGIKAYHGSPHDFDRFDLSKIGTGEGAQAYGHGLYFAEGENVAKSYRNALSAKRKFVGDELFNPNSVPHAVAELVDAHGGDITAAHNALLKEVPTNDLDRRLFAEGLDLLSKGNIPKITSAPIKGHMYEVNINADPAHFLDWDKPLSQQHPTVRDALERVNPGITEEGRTIKSLLPVESQTSSQLREAGIPGIKYLDQGSRGAGQGSSNYVVFNDRLIDIMRKYGLAGLPAGALAMGGLAAQDQYAP